MRQMCTLIAPSQQKQELWTIQKTVLKLQVRFNDLIEHKCDIKHPDIEYR